MKCASHTHKDAVATCELCKRGVCNECADIVARVSGEIEPVCPNCYNNYLKNQAMNCQAQKQKTMIFLIIMSVCYVIGIPLILSGGDSTIFIGILLCGIWWFPGGLKWMVNAGRAEVEMFGYDYKTTVDNYGNVQTTRNTPYLKYFVFVLILFVLGAITTPILILKNLMTFLKLKKSLANLENAIVSDQQLSEILNQIA